MKKLFTAIFVLFALVACGAPVTGVVVGKDYDKAYSRKYQKSESYACGTTTATRWIGKVATRSTTTKYCNRTVPATERVPEDWDISVKDEKGQVHEVDERLGEYMSYNNGDQNPRSSQN